MPPAHCQPGLDGPFATCMYCACLCMTVRPITELEGCFCKLPHAGVPPMSATHRKIYIENRATLPGAPAESGL